MNEADFVPERFSKVKFEDIPKDIVDKIQKMHETKKGLFLFGDCGTGKTHIAYAIWQWFRDGQVQSIFCKSTEILDSIKDSYGRKDFDTRDSILSRLMDFKGLLIIDDLGVEKATDWVAETFYKLFDKRYEEMRITVFTSNLSLGDLSEKISDRLSSRIAEMCDVVRIKGKDRRL